MLHLAFKHDLAFTGDYAGAAAADRTVVDLFGVAELFALAVESAPAGSALHAVAEQGVPLRHVAEAIARRLDVPARSITADEAPEYVRFLAGFVALDSPASGAATQALLGWRPSQPTLLDDIEGGRYG